jgi:hypothetical protein
MGDWLRYIWLEWIAGPLFGDLTDEEHAWLRDWERRKESP